MNNTKSRYKEYPFAKGWASVSQITGIPSKDFLYQWYWKNCKHVTPNAYQITKESQTIGKLIDNAIQHYFEDEDIPEAEKKLVEKAGEAKDYYYQSLRNFHTFVDHFKPKSILGQQVVYHKELRYIGTFDRLLLIKNRLVLVDWKATNHVGYEYKLQLEAYYRALTNMIKCGIINIDFKWAKNNLMIVQLPKKEDIDLSKHVIEFSSDDDRFEQGFQSLLKFHYQKQKEK